MKKVSEKVEEVKISRRDVTKMFAALKEVKDFKGLKFAYAVKKNKDKLMVIIKPVMAMEEKMNQPDEKYTEYCKLGTEINGNRELNKEQKEKETEKLNKKFKATVKRTADLNKEYNEIMDEEVEEQLDFHKVDFAFIPEEITAQLLDDLEFMINDL